MSTSTQALKTAATGKASEAKSFPAMLEQFKAEIARALPKHLNPDRMARIALTAFRRTPKLGECDPRSVFAAVIQASQLGLEVDTLGRAYLIPYGKECQFIPGWKGLVELVNRSGQGSVWTGAVFEGDQFDWALGDTPFVKHKPIGEDSATKLTHVYAVGRTKGAEWPIIEVWPIAKVTKHRDKYNKVGKRHYSFDNLEMYARKVVLLQVLKYMPMSPELSTAVALDDAAEVGSQGLNVNDAIDGTWVPVDPDPVNQYEQEQQGNKEAVNTQTGEINVTAPEVTFTVIADRLRKATDPDLLDAEADLIAEIKDPKQQEELTALYKRSREALTK
jgi:recombination protein RecT